eukprot:CAMPEP_0183343372 /NCGR_PEP_ID=MMETSP0164_2-20130417/9304_1 /TAXON_ID=221442 /ORGANISM="Coccolithus pelagicus ssp braarudi, Strain PLY182g" /LENGTH=153 /DNA_ID=CAMNT_0025514179 /DNA_START=56 /DNA_END=513 /DNA_ORIENTATION=+
MACDQANDSSDAICECASPLSTSLPSSPPAPSPPSPPSLPPPPPDACSTFEGVGCKLVCNCTLECCSSLCETCCSVAPPSITYRPGELMPTNAQGLQLSKGLSSTLLAVTGARVVTTTTQSELAWHDQPDGGGCFPKPETGGWVYASNSEVGG